MSSHKQECTFNDVDVQEAASLAWQHNLACKPVGESALLVIGAASDLVKFREALDASKPEQE